MSFFKKLFAKRKWEVVRIGSGYFVRKKNFFGRYVYLSSTGSFNKYTDMDKVLSYCKYITRQGAIRNCTIANEI